MSPNDEEFDPARHADLREAGGDPPEVLRALSGPAAHLAAALGGRGDEVTDRIVGRILSQVSAYDRSAEVPRDDLWWSVRRNVDTVLTALARGEPTPAAVLTVRGELGRRRARQGLGVTEVLWAFQIGYLEAWEIMREEAVAMGTEAERALLERAGNVWGTMHRISAAVSIAYAEETSSREFATRRLALAFLAALEGLPETRETAVLAAADLGFLPEDDFTVAVASGAHVRELPAKGTVAVEQADRVIVIAGPAPGGGGTPGGARDALAAPDPEKVLLAAGMTAIGVGVGRAGVLGAQRSLRDAESAHRLAVATGTCCIRFVERWFDCLALHHADQLGSVASDLVAALADNELLQTARAYQDTGTLKDAAARLHVHAGTVAYRLGQLAKRTGVDVRSGEGAVQLRLAMSLLDAAPQRSWRT